IVAAVEVLILVIIMLWRDHRLFNKSFWGGIARSLSVTGFTVMTTYTMVHIFQLESTDRGFVTLGAKLFLIIVPTLVVHVGVSSLYGLEEVKPVIARLRQVVLKPVRIQ